MATSRSRDTTDLRPTAKVVPLPGLGASHSELVREAATTRWTKVHGHDVAYRQAGEGPLLVMIHGIAGSSGTWVPVMPLLAERYTVIAPDLLGHGESAKPRGDYSLGAYASGVRDLLGVLGHERATVVGHSLGGGVAMQFAYQFPQMAERLVLVCSGGLGKEVTPAAAGPHRPGHRVRAAGGAAPRAPRRARRRRARPRPARAARRSVPRARCGKRGLASPTCGRSEPSSTRSAPSSTSPASASARATGSTSRTRCPR